jgi:hypothetical protein
MFIKNSIRAAVAALALGAAGVASADVVTLTFEGVGDFNAVGNYYNGGGGTNYGISFSNDTLALVDSDAGGSGNFANEPSGDTIMFFINANNAILNMAAGFTSGFSFFYSSSTAATVNVYDGINGTGNVLGSLNLTAQGFQNCVGDPTGQFCNWTAVGVSFSGIAKSINFGGTANQTGFDNITFGSATPGGTVPEPTTLALVGAALLAAGAARRKA